MIKKKKYRNASAGGSSSKVITDINGNYSYDGRLFYDKDGNELYVLDNGESVHVGDNVSVADPNDKSKAAAVTVLNTDDGVLNSQAVAVYNGDNNYVRPDPTIAQQNDSLTSIKSSIDSLTKFKAQAKQANANPNAIINALKQLGMPNNSGLSIEQNHSLQDGIDPAQGKIITGNYQLIDILNFIDLLIRNYTYVSKELELQLSLEGLLNTKTTQTATQTIPKQDKPVNTINKKTETKTETNNTNSNTVVDTKNDKKRNTAYYYMGAGLIIIGVSIFLMLKNK